MRAKHTGNTRGRAHWVERVALDGAGAGMRSVHCATDQRSTALDSALDPDGVQRLDVLDVGRLHVGVDEEEQGGLGAKDLVRGRIRVRFRVRVRVRLGLGLGSGSGLGLGLAPKTSRRPA